MIGGEGKGDSGVTKALDDGGPGEVEIEGFEKASNLFSNGERGLGGEFNSNVGDEGGIFKGVRIIGDGAKVGNTLGLITSAWITAGWMKGVGISGKDRTFSGWGLIEAAIWGWEIISSKLDWLTGLCDNSFEEVPNVIANDSWSFSTTASLGFHLPGPNLNASSDPTWLAAALEVLPFIKLAKLIPLEFVVDVALTFQRAFEASISLSNFSVISLSSSVGPVPILCNLGGLAPPPINEAKEGVEEDDNEFELEEDAAKAKMLALADEVSLESNEVVGGVEVS